MEAPRTVLDVIQQAFDEPLGPDLIDGMSRMSASDIARLYQPTSEWEDSFQAPYKPITELRPYIPHGDNFTTWEMLDDVTPFKTADAIKHRLLFCHSIAIRSPLPILVSNLADGFDSGIERTLRRHFVTLLQLAPLIEQGIVTFVPLPNGPKMPYWMTRSTSFRHALKRRMGPLEGKTHAKFLSDLAPSLDMTDYPRFVYAPSSPPPRTLPEGVDEWQQHFLLRAFNYISESMGMVVTTAGGVDLVMSYRHQDQALRWLLGAAPANGGSLRTPEVAVLSHLLKLQLPALEDLDVRDIVAIRQQDEAFEAWRSSLSRALAILHTMDINSLSNVERRSFLALELEESARELRAKVNLRKPGARARGALADFALGAVAIVGGSAIGGALGAATAASLGGLALKDAVKLVLDGRADGTEHAQLSHYAVFR